MASVNLLRFLFVVYIVNGHFGHLWSQNPLWLQLTKQHNMVVGAFFLFSGFFLSQSHRTQAAVPVGHFYRRRLLRILPLYWCVWLLALPLFIFLDLHYHASPLEIIGHGFLTVCLLQSWSPDWGLLWNSPTWFLSSLVFCYLVFPWAHAHISKLAVTRLRPWLWGIYLFLLLARIFYSAIHGFYDLEELSATASDRLFNFMRFFPVFNLCEFLLGMGLWRLLQERTSVWPKAQSYVLLGSLMLGASFVLRLGILPLNDLLSRSLMFIPALWLLLLGLHSLPKAKPSVSCWQQIAAYGNEISFPIYILHGAVGQLFYKKAMAWLWTEAPPPYWMFCVTVGLGSVLLFHLVSRPLSRLLARV